MISLRKKLCHRRQKMKSFGNHEDYLARIAKSLYYVHLPLSNCTSLPVTELAVEIFAQTNKFSLNRLDIEKAAEYTRNGCISPCLLVLALLYLERLKSSNPKYLAQVSPTELFLISILVGSKFLQDDGEEDELNNTDWASLTGLTVKEINKAEKEFLDAINWEVFVSEEEFWNRFNLLESKVGLRQGSNRGWFTYTELNLLLQLIDLSNIIQCFWSVTSSCMLSYAASVLALVGSALLVSQIPGLELKPKVPMTKPGDWTNSSPSAMGDKLLISPDRIEEDCNYLSLGESRTECNVTQPEFLNFSLLPKLNVRRDSNLEDVDLNFPDSFCFPPTSFLEMGHLIVDKSTETNPGLLSSQNFDFWIWSDYIRNFWKKQSIPRGLHMIASF